MFCPGVTHMMYLVWWFKCHTILCVWQEPLGKSGGAAAVSSILPRAHGDESGDVGVDITWAAQLKYLLASGVPVVQDLLQAVHSLHGLPNNSQGSALDSDFIAYMIEEHRPNMQKLIKNKGWEGLVLVDHALAIWLYTIEHPSIYSAINEAMFSPSRRVGAGGASPQLQQAMPFIRYLNRALLSLPQELHFQGTCFRGIRWVFPSPQDHDLKKHFSNRATLFFYEFKSSTQDRSVMGEERFCGRTGARTIFQIEAMTGYKIDAFSHFGEKEKEVLFPPLSKFEVVSFSQFCEPDSSDVAPDIIVLKQV